MFRWVRLVSCGCVQRAMEETSDPYQLLGVERDCDESEVRKRFQSLAKVVSEAVCFFQGGRLLLGVTCS